MRAIESTFVPVFTVPDEVMDGAYYELEIGDHFGKSLFRWCSQQLPSSPWHPLENIADKVIAIVPDEPQPLPLFVAAARNLKPVASEPAALDQLETPDEKSDMVDTEEIPKRAPYTLAERKLQPFENLATGLAHGERYAGSPAACDVCKTQLAHRRFMIDGNTQPGGCMWACMCAECFLKIGEGIGWGKGQLYTQLENGDWLMTAGFRPED